MQTKLELCKNILTELENILMCPICGAEVVAKGQSLICKNNHTFDLSKKGVVVLQKQTKLYSSTIYSKELFESRRRVILSGLYGEVYRQVAEILSIQNKSFIALDLGSGEGTHLHKIKSLCPNLDKAVAVDISKPAIDMASDYLVDWIVPIVADVLNLPFLDNSIDVMLDFLSPLFVKESLRVLNDSGILIKVIPNSCYLKEIREIISKDSSDNSNEVIQNIKSKANVEKIIPIKYIKEVPEEIRADLFKMTPLTSKIVVDNDLISKLTHITIDLLILIIKK